jgi:hypothetical protein
MGWIIAIVLMAVLGLFALCAPVLVLGVMGYLVQKFKFGNSFKETHAYHKEQDELEREHAAKENN